MKYLWTIFLALALAQVASAYTYIFNNDQPHPVRWPPGTVTMHVRLGSQSTTSDGNVSAAAISAIGIWNANLATVQFNPINDGNGVGTDNDSTNQMFFSNTAYGMAFGNTTLAITTDYLYGTDARAEADIVFNNTSLTFSGTAYPIVWDSYRGPQKGSSNSVIIDIRRIALHELGHVLGLGHPDQAVPAQVVTAIMNSVAGDLDTLAADDTTGAQHLYGIPGAGAPSNDNFANAIPITLSGGNATVTGSNIYPNAATREGGEPLIVNNAGGHSVWWKWTAPATSTVTIDTRTSYFDTIMAVYTGASVGGLTLVAQNDDENPAAPPATISTSLVSFPATAGVTYYISVDGWNDGPGHAYSLLGATGDITLHVVQAVVNTPPSISNPSNTTVNVGVAAQFTITASGTPTPTLQWQRLPLGGAWANLVASSTYVGVNSTTLTINNTVVGMTNDQFRCVATNSSGTATSNAAYLTVVQPQPPVITQQPGDPSPAELANATFTMSASSATSITYQWQVSTDGGSTWANVPAVSPYTGTTSPSLTITNVSSTLSGNYYRCLATNVTGTTPTLGVPLTVNRPTAAVTLAAGRYHSLRLDAAAHVFVTGTNTYGQLGNGNTTTRIIPQQITIGGGQVIARIAAGAQHSVFLDTSGGTWSAGINDHGQLGDGTLTANSTPLQTASNIAGIAAGLQHTALLDKSGTLRTLGGNDEGQLGNGSSSGANVLSPVQIATNVVDLAAGIRQTLFVKADGTLWGTGDLYGNATLNYAPVQIATNVKTVAAGGYHSLFLKNDGTLWALGYNPFGQLGTGDTTDRTTPVQIATNVKAIATGFFHSLFIKTDNTLWAFGRNESGQIGDGTTTNRTSPYQVASGVLTMSASESYTLFTLSDGSLWGTGLNGNGQFGNNVTTTVSTPVRITGGITAAAGIPLGLSVTTNATQDRLTLTWIGQSSDATYEVWRSTTNSFGSATRIATGVRWGIYQDVSVTDNTTYYYWVTGVNGTSTSSPSSSQSFTYHTLSAPGFSGQPSSSTIGIGAYTTFSVTVVGSPTPTLQWQRQPAAGGGFTSLTNNSTYSGVTTSVLTVGPSTSAMNGDQFRCVATNSVSSATSNVAILTVNASVVAGDMNGDHGSDILWENTVTGDRGFYLMNGTSFSSWVYLGAVSTAWRITGTGDFDGDGKNDILWENTATGEHYFWFMNGTTFSSGVSLGVISTDWRVAAIADFNNDGKPDILWENTVTGERGFYLMNGTTFVSWVSLGIVSTDWHIAGAGDFNGDHKPDLVWENTVNGDRSFWLMNGTTFSSLVDFGYVSTDWRIGGVGDFNGDGLGDLLWENTGSGLRYIWLMNGSAITSAVSEGTISTDWRIAN